MGFTPTASQGDPPTNPGVHGREMCRRSPPESGDTNLRSIAKSCHLISRESHGREGAISRRGRCHLPMWRPRATPKISNVPAVINDRVEGSGTACTSRYTAR